jgi:hypothetical protein
VPEDRRETMGEEKRTVSVSCFGHADGDPMGYDIAFGDGDGVVVTITPRQARHLRDALDAALSPTPKGDA